MKASKSQISSGLKDRTEHFERVWPFIVYKFPRMTMAEKLKLCQELYENENRMEDFVEVQLKNPYL